MNTLYFLAFLAGGLSLLAPCVLPLLPMIVTHSFNKNKLGPLVMATGLVLSFTIFGILSSAFAKFIHVDTLKTIGAVILVVSGLGLLMPVFLKKFKVFLNLFAQFGLKMQKVSKPNGKAAHLLQGATLGLIWSPCTGPTLAFASGLATQSNGLAQAIGIHLFFGIGTAVSLLLIGVLLRRFVFLNGVLKVSGNMANLILGSISIIIGLLLLSGYDGVVEEYLLQHLPESLVRLSLKF